MNIKNKKLIKKMNFINIKNKKIMIQIYITLNLKKIKDYKMKIIYQKLKEKKMNQNFKESLNKKNYK